MPLLGEKEAENHMKVFLPNGAINPSALPPQTIWYDKIYHLSEHQRHQRPPVDVNKSEAASVRVAKVTVLI